MTRTCETCGVALVPRPGGGRPARFCPLHRDRRNQARDLRVAMKAGDAAHVQAVTGSDRPSAGESIRLAAAMSIEPDLRQAGRLAGLDLDLRALEELALEARRHHGALAAGEEAARAHLFGGAAAVLAARIVGDALKVGPASLAPAVRALVDARNVLTGGARPTYSHVRLIIRGPGGRTVEVGGAPKPKKASDE